MVYKRDNRFDIASFPLLSPHPPHRGSRFLLLGSDECLFPLSVNVKGWYEYGYADICICYACSLLAAMHSGNLMLLRIIMLIKHMLCLIVVSSFYGFYSMDNKGPREKQTEGNILYLA